MIVGKAKERNKDDLLGTTIYSKRPPSGGRFVLWMVNFPTIALYFRLQHQVKAGLRGQLNLTESSLL